MFMLNGSPLPIDTPFEVDGTHYPANWLRLTTLEEKQAIGITEVPDPEPWDDRFYWGVGNPKLLEDREEVDKDGNPMWVQVLDNTDPANPRMVDSDKRLVTKGLKSQWIAQVKDTANKLLAQTDWMVIRKIERGVDIPADVATYRAAVIAECTRLKDAISAPTTVEELISAVTSQNWPTTESK